MIENKQALFATFKKKSITLTDPVSGQDMVFNELSVRDQSDYRRIHSGSVGDTDKLAYLAAFVIVRASNFLEDSDIDALLDGMSLTTLNHFSIEILKLSGMLKGAEEEAEKN